MLGEGMDARKGAEDGLEAEKWDGSYAKAFVFKNELDSNKFRPDHF
jgi:hypothetical protein